METHLLIFFCNKILIFKVYELKVKFKAGMFGSFSQWVVFDFGFQPVLVCKVNVEVGTKFIQDKVKKLRQQLQFDRYKDKCLYELIK